jgi:cobalt-zinc-cadmium efflux system membrane fusion protein
MKFIIPILLLVTFSCSTNQNLDESENEQQESIIILTKEQMDASGMEIGSIQMQDFDKTIEANGRIQAHPSNHFFISALFPGYVKEMKSIPGDVVKKGQVIAMIEHPELLELQENYVIALSEHTYLEQEYKRLKELELANAIAKKDFYKVTNEFNRALATRNKLEQQLKMLNLPLKEIQSGNFYNSYPILAIKDGVIAQVNCVNGEFIGTDKQLFELVNIARLQLSLELFEKDVLFIKEGQQINFQLSGKPNVLSAQVIRIGSQLNADRRVNVTAELSSETEGAIIIGGYVNAQIILQTESLAALPLSAVVKKGESFYALIKTSEPHEAISFKQITVHVIAENNQFVAIDMKDLSEKSLFLLNGTFDLVR